jgi:hypothetical protein
MKTTNTESIEAIKAEILAQLNCDPSHPPMHVDDKSAAAVLGIQANTLACWRSVGRYNLPFIKTGRSVRYRISDLAEFLARRTACSTGGAK